MYISPDDTTIVYICMSQNRDSLIRICLKYLRFCWLLRVKGLAKYIDYLPILIFSGGVNEDS